MTVALTLMALALNKITYTPERKSRKSGAFSQANVTTEINFYKKPCRGLRTVSHLPNMPKPFPLHLRHANKEKNSISSVLHSNQPNKQMEECL